MSIETFFMLTFIVHLPLIFRLNHIEKAIHFTYFTPYKIYTIKIPREGLTIFATLRRKKRQNILT